MCDWCKENNGEALGCQQCGCMICWDVEPNQGDDILSRPFVTSSGDVYCSYCGRRMERAEQKAMEEEACYFPDDPYDLI
jgi:hypothetical protein